MAKPSMAKPKSASKPPNARADEPPYAVLLLGLLPLIALLVPSLRPASFSALPSIVTSIESLIPKPPPRRGVVGTPLPDVPFLPIDLEASGSLSPADLGPLPVYADYDNSSWWGHPVSRGSVPHLGTAGRHESDFAVLPGIVTAAEVEAILRIANATFGGEFDADPDSVDGMASHEIFLDSDELREGRTAGSLKGDATAEGRAEREAMRRQLKEVTDPILSSRLTPFIRESFPDLCASPGRLCTPCYSLVRRYRPGERLSHQPHRDAHARVTAVVSLSVHGVDYRGGIYVAAARSDKRVAALGRVRRHPPLLF
jgi:hypothetical protein